MGFRITGTASVMKRKTFLSWEWQVEMRFAELTTLAAQMGDVRTAGVRQRRVSGVSDAISRSV